MWTLPLAGLCALASQVLSTWGNFAQIRLNARRRSTEGLSFFYWESRVWSKLPWFAFVLSLRTVDYSLLASMALALIPPFLVLHQFAKYQLRKDSVFRQRIRIQYGFLLVSLCLALLARESIAGLGILLAVIPVVCTIISVAGGGLAQFQCNRLRGNSEAVAGERYILLVISNLLWFTYGTTKGLQHGWDEAWTICCCSGIGTLVYLTLSLQYASLRGNGKSSPQETVLAEPILGSL